MEGYDIRDWNRESTYLKYTIIPRQKKKMAVHSIIWILFVILINIGFNSELPSFLEDNLQYLSIALVLYTSFAFFQFKKLRTYKKQLKEYELLINNHRQNRVTF